MGSPQNYYGVGTLKGTTVVHDDDPSTSTAGTPALDVGHDSPAGTPWVASTGTLVAAVNSANAAYDYTTTNNATQQFGGFGLNTGLPAGESISGNITGLQVTLTNASVSAACATTKIGVALSWDGGTTWTTVVAQTGALTTTTASTTLRLDERDHVLDGPHHLDRIGHQQRQLPRPADRHQGLRDRRDADPSRSAPGPGLVHHGQSDHDHHRRMRTRPPAT